jgi:anti-sigma factor RsiW
MRTPCTQARENLVRYLDGELAGVEAESLRAHLDACAECRAELESIRMLRKLWEQAPAIESSPADRAAILAEARRMIEPSAGWFERLRDWLTPSDLVTAGAVVASVALAVVLIGDGESSGLPPGWSRSSTVLSLAEARARESGMPVEIDEDLDLIRMSYAGERPLKERWS